MLAYIDAGTAAAIAAMATGGLAGAKVAVQSMFTRWKKTPAADTELNDAEDLGTDAAPADVEPIHATDIASAELDAKAA